MNGAENIDYCIRYLLKQNDVKADTPRTLAEKRQLLRALMNVWEPKELPEEFLAMQDAELQAQAADKGVVTIESLKSNAESNPFLLWQGDITRLQADAIVNAANAQALGCWSPLHNCIDNCIHSAAGLQLRKACYDHMQGRLLATGDAFITRGYNLPAKYVLHTVGPIVTDDRPTKQQEEQLASCYRRCMELAEENGRFILDQKGETVYSASIGPNNGSLTEDALRNLFHFIKIDWNTGEM